AFLVAGSPMRSFAFVGLSNTPTQYTEVHEATHITTNLRNSVGGHVDLVPGNVTDRMNLMHNGTIDTAGVANTKRLSDQNFTNTLITPSILPAQISAIRTSRFPRPF